ncbi:MAG TPA: S9 family peptidase, partial [Sphingomicrobium sp.]|nr:S9 family peptidase [Sphingomicrobium sp.]
MKNWFLAGAAAAALIATPAHAQPVRSLAEDAAAFGAREAVSAARLSPDGSKLLYVTPGPGLKSFAVISDLQTGKTSIVTSADGEPESLSWCDYSGPDRLVCRVTGQVVQTGDIIGFQRLLAMNTDGTDAKLLGQPSSFYDAGYRQFDGSVLDWNGAIDGTILMQREYVPEAGRAQTRISRKKSGLGVDRVDTRTLRVTRVEPPRDAASGYMTDGRGNVRIMTTVESSATGSLTGRVKYFYRTLDSREWKTLVEYADREDQIRPAAVDAEINSIYVLKKKDGRRALYAVKLDGSLGERLVAEHPRVDISGVMRSGDGQRVIGYRFSDEQSERVYFDPEFKALSESLSKALPDLPIVSFFDSTMDGRKLLIFAGSDMDPGSYYLFDRDAKTLNQAMVDRPQLEGRTLAQVKSVTIPAPDGVQIPAYLTLPPGRDAKGLPAIVLPHGGPSSRDYWGFDWLAQFFAARGYAVLQPQYRGSAGYGDAWLNDNGFKNWRTSIGDISASARWLVAQGIANPDRVAIVGWSYGGYAALQSAVTDPSLYKAVAAIAPVTDLQMLKKDAAGFTNAQLVEKFIGSGPHVAEGSPLKRAAEIQVPVLLIHGDMDSNVRYWHSEKMRDALQGAGKQVEFVGYKGYDHYLDDSKVRA